RALHQSARPCRAGLAHQRAGADPGDADAGVAAVAAEPARTALRPPDAGDAELLPVLPAAGAGAGADRQGPLAPPDGAVMLHVLMLAFAAWLWRKQYAPRKPRNEKALPA